MNQRNLRNQQEAFHKELCNSHTQVQQVYTGDFVYKAAYPHT